MRGAWWWWMGDLLHAKMCQYRVFPQYLFPVSRTVECSFGDRLLQSAVVTDSYRYLLLLLLHTSFCQLHTHTTTTTNTNTNTPKLMVLALTPHPSPLTPHPSPLTPHPSPLNTNPTSAPDRPGPDAALLPSPPDGSNKAPPASLIAAQTKTSAATARGARAPLH